MSPPVEFHPRFSATKIKSNGPPSSCLIHHHTSLSLSRYQPNTESQKNMLTMKRPPPRAFDPAGPFSSPSWSKWPRGESKESSFCGESSLHLPLTPPPLRRIGARRNALVIFIGDMPADLTECHAGGTRGSERTRTSSFCWCTRRTACARNSEGG